eukprot:891273-Alexandrium_andersonii.AAC.1
MPAPAHAHRPWRRYGARARARARALAQRACHAYSLRFACACACLYQPGACARAPFMPAHV